MAIISIGTINKKLLWPLIYAITYALLHIYWSYNESNIVTLAIENLGSSIGQILTVFINCRFKYKLKREKTFKKSISKTFFILL